MAIDLPEIFDAPPQRTLFLREDDGNLLLITLAGQEVLLPLGDLIAYFLHLLTYGALRLASVHREQVQRITEWLFLWVSYGEPV